MGSENTEVKQDVSSEEVQPQEKNNSEVSDNGTGNISAYEQVRRDMLRYKAERKEKDKTISELKARLEKLESSGSDGEEEVDDEVQKRITRLEAEFLVNRLIETDPFVKDNIDLIKHKMEEDGLTIKQASDALKVEFMDRISKAESTTQMPPKQINPKGTITSVPKGDIIKEALEGRVDTADPRQLEAYKAVMSRLKK